MSDQTTNVNDVEGQVLSGSFNAAVNVDTDNRAQTVTIHMERLTPPQLDNATIREIAINAANGTQHVAEMVYWFQKKYDKDREQDVTERKERQSETDEHRDFIRVRLFWLCVVDIVLACMIGLVFLANVVGWP